MDGRHTGFGHEQPGQQRPCFFELVFSLGTLTNGGWASMAFTFRPDSAGELTNTVVVAATGVTNTFAVNVLTLVVASYADLGVSVAGPVQAGDCRRLDDVSGDGDELGPERPRMSF